MFVKLICDKVSNELTVLFMDPRLPGIGNKAQLRPARLELGLGLSLAITTEIVFINVVDCTADRLFKNFLEIPLKPFQLF